MSSKEKVRDLVNEILTNRAYDNDDHRWEGVPALARHLVERMSDAEPKVDVSLPGTAAGIFLASWRLVGSPWPRVLVRELALWFDVSVRTISTRQADAIKLLSSKEVWAIKRGKSELLVPDGAHCHLCGRELEEACVECQEGLDIHAALRTCHTCQECYHGWPIDVATGSLGCLLTLGVPPPDADVDSGPWYRVGRRLFSSLAEAQLVRAHYQNQAGTRKAEHRIYSFPSLREARAYTHSTVLPEISVPADQRR